VIAGRDLLDDLQVFITKLSGRLALRPPGEREGAHDRELPPGSMSPPRRSTAGANGAAGAEICLRGRGVPARVSGIGGRAVHPHESVFGGQRRTFRRLTDTERSRPSGRSAAWPPSHRCRGTRSPSSAAKLGIAQRRCGRSCSSRRRSTGQARLSAARGPHPPRDAAELYRLYQQAPASGSS